MEIGQEIKQTKFRNEYHKLLVNIVFTGNWINALTTRYLKKYDISPEQYNILRILKGQYPNVCTLNTILTRMLDRMSNASRLVDKLLFKGLLDRKLCLEDRRKVDIVITDKGLRLIDEIEFHVFEDTFTKISEEDAAKLNELLDKVRG